MAKHEKQKLNVAEKKGSRKSVNKILTKVKWKKGVRDVFGRRSTVKGHRQRQPLTAANHVRSSKVFQSSLQPLI